VPRRFATELFDITVDDGPDVAHLYTSYRGEPRETDGKTGEKDAVDAGARVRAVLHWLIAWCNLLVFLRSM
jgi:hypothetical protein